MFSRGASSQGTVKPSLETPGRKYAPIDQHGPWRWTVDGGVGLVGTGHRVQGGGENPALVTGTDDSATPRGPQNRRTMGPLCGGNNYITSPSLYCSLAVSLTGREQGMLIKGCENQEGKK